MCPMTPTEHHPKVALVARGERVAGGEMSLLGLAHSLPPLVLPLVWATEPGELVEVARAQGLEVHEGRWDMFDKRRPWEFVRLVAEIRGEIRRRCIDLVHVNSPVEASAFVVAARLSRVPVVVHVRIRYDRAFLRRQALSWANAVVFNSQALKDEIGWPGGRVVHNGVRVGDRPGAAEKSQARAELGIPQNALVVAQFGQIIPRKAVDTGLRVLAALVERGTDARFLAVGEDPNGDTLDQLKQLAHELGVEDRVTFTGYRRNATALMPAADVVLFPSREEAFGRVAIESMAQGVPVVAARVGGVVEIIEHDHSGFLAPVDDVAAMTDAVYRLLVEPPLYERIRKAGRERVMAAFTDEVHAQRMRAVYRDLLGSPQPGAQAT